MMKKICKWLPAAATLLLAAMLIVQCLQIYFAGTAPENYDANGALIRDIFSREDVASRLRGIAWAFWVWIGAIIIGLIFGERKKPRGPKGRMTPKPEPEARGRNIWRIALYIAAAALVVLGIFNGGMRDVLVKAINICTECIGLG